MFARPKAPIVRGHRIGDYVEEVKRMGEKVKQVGKRVGGVNFDNIIGYKNEEW
jgi:hypothetical protein